VVTVNIRRYSGNIRRYSWDIHRYSGIIHRYSGNIHRDSGNIHRGSSTEDVGLVRTPQMGADAWCSLVLLVNIRRYSGNIRRYSWNIHLDSGNNRRYRSHCCNEVEQAHPVPLLLSYPQGPCSTVSPYQQNKACKLVAPYALRNPCFFHILSQGGVQSAHISGTRLLNVLHPTLICPCFFSRLLNDNIDPHQGSIDAFECPCSFLLHFQFSDIS
jgi:hypothetical protein